jgi:hypothetical protein
MPQMANYQDAGDPKPGATVLLVSTPAGKRKPPLLVTENYGRGRTVLFATEGSWRWKMWLPHDDKTQPTFWQQILRYLVTDTPGQVTSSTPKSVLSDETKVPLRVEVRDKQYKPVTNAKVQARFMGPDGVSATVELTPQPLEEGIYSGEWTAEKPGSYVADIIAGREQEEIGRDVVTFRREDGVAENFHTSQNRELLEKLSVQTGGRYYTSPAKRPSWRMKSRTRKRASPRAKHATCGICPRSSCWLSRIRACEWLLRRRWGVV